VSDFRSVGEKRLDAFVDASFAFAVSILVVGTGGVAESYDSLLEKFGHVPSFLLSLIIILSFWWAHRQYSQIVRRSDKLNDALSILIMFVIMVYVYPVSFLMQSLVHWLSDGTLPGRGMLPEQIRQTYLIFGVGLAFLSAIYAWLYSRAARAHNRLRVASRFHGLAKRASRWWALCAVTAILSILVAQFGGLQGLIWLPLLPYLLLFIALAAKWSKAQIS